MAVPAVQVRGLRKVYGAVEAVRGIDLDIPAGQVFALLGPNGAGKTTTVEILEGYRRRDAGEVRVLGCDPARDGSRLRERIGIVTQQTALDGYLRATSGAPTSSEIGTWLRKVFPGKAEEIAGWSVNVNRAPTEILDKPLG